MKKDAVIAFFDKLASGWDANQQRNELVIQTILDNSEVMEGKTVLDVACGTGVLIPDYLERKISRVVGIDISSEMIRIAQSKFEQNEVEFVCADVEHWESTEQFDCVMVYNAFPHFPEPARLLQTLATKVKPGGTLTIAHGASRAEIDACHHGAAAEVSMGLMEAEELVRLLPPGLSVCHMISNENMYQIVAKK